MGEEIAGRDDGGRLSFEFSFNGRPVLAHSGDSIASALVRSGVHVFSRSMKFHRPRGLYCGANRCYSCAMRVNGVPGVRTCATSVESGMIVETEGGVPSARYDLLSVFDHVFRKQFDHQSRFISPVFMVPTYQRVVRRLATSRRLPDKPRTYSHLEVMHADVLIVGHGVSGKAACDRLRALGVNPYVVDRHGTDVFTPSIAFGYYEDGRVGVLSETSGRLVRAKAVLFATGCVETGLDLVNGDLPGVLLPEAVAHLVERGVSPGKRVFIIGKSELSGQVTKDLESAGSKVVEWCENPAEVSRLTGRNKIQWVEVVRNGGRLERVPCDSVVLLGPLVPYVNLAQQAGCELKSVDGLWFVATDHEGRTTIPSVFSCGSVTGLTSVQERTVSGTRSADSIARFLGVT